MTWKMRLRRMAAELLKMTHRVSAKVLEGEDRAMI